MPANDGTVFSLTPPASSGGSWTENVLHSFTGGSDGGFPSGGLAIHSGGDLFGTTQGALGLAPNGTVFRVHP